MFVPDVLGEAVSNQFFILVLVLAHVNEVLGVYSQNAD
jgi:hypothetical protein